MGTFTVTIDGDRVGAGTETSAQLQVQFAAGRTAIKDAVGDRFIFPHTTAKEPTSIQLPATLILETDVASGAGVNSDDIGYRIVVLVPKTGGKVDTGEFAARPADTVIDLTDLVADFTGSVAESIAVRAEVARDEAEAAAAAVNPGAPNGTATLDGAARLPESQVPDRLSAASLDTEIAAEMATVDADAGSAFRVQQDARYVPQEPGTLARESVEQVYASPTDGSAVGWTTPTVLVAKALGWWIVTEYGVVADGTTNNTTTYDTLVAAAEATISDRHGLGVTLYFPAGDYVGKLTITSSIVSVAGAGSGGTVLRPSSTTTGVVEFTDASLALYNCGLTGVRIVCAGNQTAGTSLRLHNVIYFRLHDVTLNGHYTGIDLNDAHKVIATGVVMSQEARTSGATGLPLTVQGGCSDIHFTDMQIMRDPATHGTNTISVTGVDGLYFNNCHWHGRVVLNAGSGATVASVWWTACYFDGSPADLLRFEGGSGATAYRNFRVCNCNFRQGTRGITFTASGMVSRVVVTGSTFYDNTEFGIYCVTANVSVLLIATSIFAGNNSGNAASNAHLWLDGANIKLSDFIVDGGGAAGYGIRVASTATNVFISDGDLTSAAVVSGNRINNLGSGSFKVRDINGVADSG